MELVKTYGGREKFFKQKSVRDCVTRAIAVATESDYMAIYLLLKKYSYGNSPRDGVHHHYYGKLLAELGWKRVDCSDMDLRLGQDELPEGTLIIEMKGHLTTVKDGVLYDSWDPSKKKDNQILGYWYKKPYKYKSMLERQEDLIRDCEEKIKRLESKPEEILSSWEITHYKMELERLKDEKIL